jgi:hypothetical protein
MPVTAAGTSRRRNVSSRHNALVLHIQRATGESRFPLYDEIGSARGLVDAFGTVTDATLRSGEAPSLRSTSTYALEAFGGQRASTGTRPNTYRYGAAPAEEAD